MKTIRVLIVDDDSMFREVIRELLAMESDMEVIGEAGNGLEAIQQTK
ncbi:MAG: DNA-binding response regulator, partial [Deltaproteobacteria bacterium]